MRSPVSFALLAVLGAGVLWLLVPRPAAAMVPRSRAPVTGAGKPPPSGGPPMAPGAGVRLPAWRPPTSAVAYLSAIRAAELANSIPENLLARLLYQESRFRPDIISGQVKSSAGAVGIAQIIPRYHPGVDPLDPFAAIAYAARFLADLRRRLGSWDKALAAYNWGQGNLARVATSAEWLSKAPEETRRYVAEILRDVPAARGVPT